MVAINCHPFHDIRCIFRCLQSVATAALANKDSLSLEVFVFWHHHDVPPESLIRKASDLNFVLKAQPHQSNAENLNAQIDLALALKFELFFRVDGDDTVTPKRFAAQTAMLSTADCDICGAGLIYVQPGSPNRIHMPPAEPTVRDYIENRFLLHPTMAFDLRAIQKTGLRYRLGRLEDKALIAKALRLKLKIKNAQIIAGRYYVGPASRNDLRSALHSLWLNLTFLTERHAFVLSGYAVLLATVQITLGPRRLREFRYLMHRKHMKNTRREI